MTAPIAVMGYTVLEQALTDLEGTLDRIASLGYLGIETYGLVEEYGATRVRDAVAAAGLRVTSAHTPFPAGEAAGRILDDALELGAPTLIWSMEREEFGTRDAIARGVERVNEAAENAAAHGLTIGYHNHFAEFANTVDGGQAYDVLLGLLDPRVVVELDAYWARMGGADPAEVLARLGDRARFIHIKDGPAESYEDDLMVPIGEGAMDWAGILTAPSGLAWHIVELERLSVDTFGALATSYRHLVGGGLSEGRTP
ncbi:sugar phosphate isomerase/epimerase family protein [Leifsonia poae]|uniref:sugar phosphate isomerase/epimerase family protein n=1 Tax=Leifsonia poae TaxID=110933 RepID=UPI001CBB7223|nr:sugar phosphate isomerase/epimerase [Leifsonia poae]